MASSSVTSCTLALKAVARSAQSGSSASRRPYSFMDEPQPAAFATTVSQSSKAAIVARARSSASGSAPVWSMSAPQQRGLVRAATSQPSAASTSAVAAFTSAKNTRWTQPWSRPTRPRRSPSAGVSSGVRARPRA